MSRRQVRRRHPAQVPKRQRKVADDRSLRAKVMTLRLRDPDMSVREIAVALGQPYVIVRDLLGPPELTHGLSQYRWPAAPDEELSA